MIRLVLRVFLLALIGLMPLHVDSAVGDGDMDYIAELDVSSDETIAITAHGDFTLRVWQISEWQLLDTYDVLPLGFEPSPVTYISDVAISPDNTTAALGFNSPRGANTVTLVDLATGDLVDVIYGTDGIGDVAWSPDGRFIAFFQFLRGAYPIKSVIVWDVSGDEQVARFDYTGVDLGIGWSPDGDYLAFAAGRVVRLIVSATWSEAAVLETENVDFILALAWSPDSDMLATIDSVSTVVIWDANIGQIIKTLGGRSADRPRQYLAWNTDATLIAVTADRDFIQVWDVETAQLVEEIDTGLWGVLDPHWVSGGALLFGSGETNSPREVVPIVSSGESTP